jgi:hypothetical protein
MLIGGAVLMLFRIDTPMLQYTEWPAFLMQPFDLLAGIAVLRQQPYLSSVLPMYCLFALAVPVVVPLAGRKPVVALFASLGVWLFASSIVRVLPAGYAQAWSFNPFAWQLMFVLGVLGRVQPVSASFHASGFARWLTCAAIALMLTFAFAKLVLETQPPPGYMKQNLATLRIVSFAAIAWVVARAVRAGWIASLARKLPGVVTIGQQGLVCFVAGTCVSLVLDTALRLVSAGRFQWLAGLAADFLAIASLLWLARFWRERKSLRAMPVIKGQPAHAHAVSRRER